MHDLWYSADGATWVQATDAAPWPARSEHTSLAYDARIWVLGGGPGGYANDAWYSADGVTWFEADPATDWQARSGHASVVHDSRMWVLGGRAFGGATLDDVWYAAPAPPEVTVEQSGGQADPTNTLPITFDVMFSEPVTGFDVGDVVIGGTATGATVEVAGGDANYTVGVTAADTDGSLLATVPAGVCESLIGYGNNASTSTDNSVTLDRAAPTLSIGAPSNTLTRSGPVSYSVTYAGADAVTLAGGDVTLDASGTATGAVSVSGSGLSARTVTLSGISGDGTLGITIAAGTASDAAANVAASAGPSASFAVSNLDTDADGLTDGEETAIYGTDPNRRDTDTDGLSDGDEVTIHGTDALDRDTDDDGVNDGREVNVYGTGPLDTDSDADGFTDKEEADARTDPLDPEDFPGVVHFADANLEAAVRETIVVLTGPILDTDLVGVGFTALDASARGIRDLGGLEHCLELTTLDLSNNAFSDLAPLAWLAALSALHLESNQVSDVGALVANVGLGSGDAVYLADNPLSQVALCNDIPMLETFGVTIEHDGVCSEDREADADGDGLPNWDEENRWHSNPNDPDTDDDGMPDGFEALYNLDLLDPEDAVADSDGDELTNLEEYLEHADPTDLDSPVGTYFVSSEAGEDVADHGANRAYPWQTIAYALEQLPLSSPVKLVLLPGQYYEDGLTLPAGVSVVGSRTGEVVIEGFGPFLIAGGDSTAVRNLEVRQAEGDAAGTVLLDMFDVAMVVQGVAFIGNTNRDATGIVVEGTAPSASLIADCRFASLALGIEIWDEAPTVRRCVFDDWGEYGIVFRAGRSLKRDVGKSGLGTQDDPNSGYNTFLGTGMAVQNEGDEAIVMDNNDWDLDTATVENAEARVDGPAEINTVLEKSGAILSATVVCTTWDAASLNRILNATITLAPGLSMSSNTNGVYTFASVPAQTYAQVTAVAPDYATASKFNVEAAAGETSTVLFQLTQLAS
ncbi:MAG TPA: hypothetical protein HPP77_09455, partial [Candidatus Hydrogenedentes bacterium]|nr:hypothetical protein [Candidatus Hydrogenedentota bacterium]